MIAVFHLFQCGVKVLTQYVLFQLIVFAFQLNLNISDQIYYSPTLDITTVYCTSPINATSLCNIFVQLFIGTSLIKLCLMFLESTMAFIGFFGLLFAYNRSVFSLKFVCSNSFLIFLMLSDLLRQVSALSFFSCFHSTTLWFGFLSLIRSKMPYLIVYFILSRDFDKLSHADCAIE